MTFELGTNLDMAQVLVQNRVAIAQAKLPEEVKRHGVTTKKKSPSILLCVNLISPDGRYDQLYLSNFATLNVKDDLARIKGVGDVTFLGPRDYSMRVWLDPRAAGVAADDRRRRDQGDPGAERAGGRRPPRPAAGAAGRSDSVHLPINTQGRLTTEEQFEDIVVKTGENGQIVYLSDVVAQDHVRQRRQRRRAGHRAGRQELRRQQLPATRTSHPSHAGRLPAARLQRARDGRGDPGQDGGAQGAASPQGVEYRIVYDTTVFVEESITSVFHTLIEAFVLVFIVVLVFLQNWRATLIPMVAVPVSLIGTFAVMALLGFSLNNLSLFGLVLAIGIVVDDAIVVVENVERCMAEGLSPRDATAQGDGRGDRAGHRHRAGAVRGVRADRVHGRHQRAVLQAVRPDHRGLDGHLGVQLADAQPRAVRAAAQAARHDGHGGTPTPRRCRELGIAIIGGLIGLFFLAGPVGHLFGIEVGGGHGEEHVATSISGSPMKRTRRLRRSSRPPTGS